MVGISVLEDWDLIKEHIENYPQAEVLYKIDAIHDSIRLRVAVGRVGFDETFKAKDPRLQEIVNYIQSKSRAKIVKKQISGDIFFL